MDGWMEGRTDEQMTQLSFRTGVLTLTSLVELLRPVKLYDCEPVIAFSGTSTLAFTSCPKRPRCVKNTLRTTAKGKPDPEKRNKGKREKLKLSKKHYLFLGSLLDSLHPVMRTPLFITSQHL